MKQNERVTIIYAVSIYRRWRKRDACARYRSVNYTIIISFLCSHAVCIIESFINLNRRRTKIVSRRKASQRLYSATTTTTSSDYVRNPAPSGKNIRIKKTTSARSPRTSVPVAIHSTVTRLQKTYTERREKSYERVA